jgi:hypothetical protein
MPSTPPAAPAAADGDAATYYRVQGKLYPASMLYEDITWDAPRQYDEGGQLTRPALHYAAVVYQGYNAQCKSNLCGRQLAHALAWAKSYGVNFALELT